MFASIFILILFLPIAFLPLGLDAFVSNSDLEKMGISLENSDDICAMRGCELAGLFSISNCDEVWEIGEPLQTY